MKRKNAEFYKTTKWATIRRSVLVRDKYLCQNCKANNKAVNATCVHHVFPLENYPEYKYEFWNLISLCDKCHDEMHNHFTGDLSKKGMLFLRSVAAVRNIPVTCKKEKILVVGLRGCGKSTYCRNNLDDFSLVYDMDAIASAFRLKMPHEEIFKPARRMANDFLKGFLLKAQDYAPKIYIIRTAPTIKEFEEIKPDRVVFCMKQYVSREMDDRKSALQRIIDLQKYCENNNVSVEIFE